MIQCEHISNRMPAVALGRAIWTREEQAHLDACEDCRTEWVLVRAAAHLGGSLQQSRDPEVLTAGILGRVAGARAALRARRRTWLMAGLAAAAVTIIAVRIPRAPSEIVVPATSPSGPVVPVEPAPAEPARQSVALPELEDLPDAELESILGSLDESPGAGPALDGSGFDNSDDHELERVLDAWEG